MMRGVQGDRPGQPLWLRMHPGLWPLGAVGLAAGSRPMPACSEVSLCFGLLWGPVIDSPVNRSCHLGCFGVLSLTAKLQTTAGQVLCPAPFWFGVP